MMESSKEKSESKEDTNSEFEKESKESGTGSSKKDRKKYEWTPKRKEAFAKMREGLETKVQLTKQIKQEKKLAEKEELKRRIREIMHQGGKSESSKSKQKSKMIHSSDESDVTSSSSEEEEVKPKKSSKHRSADQARRKKSEKGEKHKKRKARESSSESEGVAQSSDSSSSEEDERHVHTQSLSKRQLEQYRQNKVQSGKAQKQTPFVNPMDRFICL